MELCGTLVPCVQCIVYSCTGRVLCGTLMLCVHCTWIILVSARYYVEHSCCVYIVLRNCTWPSTYQIHTHICIAHTYTTYSSPAFWTSLVLLHMAGAFFIIPHTNTLYHIFLPCFLNITSAITHGRCILHNSTICCGILWNCIFIVVLYGCSSKFHNCGTLWIMEWAVFCKTGPVQMILNITSWLIYVYWHVTNGTYTCISTVHQSLSLMIFCKSISAVIFLSPTTHIIGNADPLIFNISGHSPTPYIGMHFPPHLSSGSSLINPQTHCSCISAVTPEFPTPGPWHSPHLTNGSLSKVDYLTHWSSVSAVTPLYLPCPTDQWIIYTYMVNP